MKSVVEQGFFDEYAFDKNMLIIYNIQVFHTIQVQPSDWLESRLWCYL